MITPRPPLCGWCQHTVRDGEAYGKRRWETDSGPSVSGAVHVGRCPGPVPVPCAPCLHAILAEDGEHPHGCQSVTVLGVESDRLVVGPAQKCPCHCSRREESDAPKAARAQVRRATGPE